MVSKETELWGNQLCGLVAARGIVTLSEDTLWLEHSCSGIELEFEGSQLILEMAADPSASDDVWFEIQSAGKEKTFRKKYKANRKPERICAIKCGTVKRQRITVIKRTEKKYGRVGLRRVFCTGRLLCYRAEERELIGFIGDSISCGYGNEGFSLLHPFSTKYENGLKAFPYLFCRMLNADYEIMAYSGMGVWRSHRDFLGETAEKQYNTERMEYLQPRRKKMVCIHLGTNDSPYIKSENDRKAFEQAYVSLLDRVREWEPDAYIVCATGPMRCRAAASIERICSEIRARGDRRIFYVPLVQKWYDGIGKGGHPTHFAQARIAKQLYHFCKREMEWEN